MLRGPAVNNPVYWVEVPVVDPGRALRFYETVFQRALSPVPIQRAASYRVFPLDLEGYGAGLALVEGTGYRPGAEGPVVYLDLVADLDEVLSRVVDAGGTILQPKGPNEGGNGFIALLKDSEGNRLGLHSSL